MYDNFRLVFSIAWLISTGFSFALSLLVIFTWNGEYLPYLFFSLAVWGVSTLGTIVTSR